jgi:hypothetical protein
MTSRTVVTLLAAVLVAPGCVRQQRFRFVPVTTACFPETAAAAPAAGPTGQKPSLDCRRAQYKMAFIEFDEKGRMFDPRQEEAARKLLDFEKARAASGTIITVVYIHGWKNNAAEAEPGAKAKDVEKFQGALLELGYRAEQAARAAKAPTVPIVGIYLAWRGKSMMGPDWVTFASFWGRRNTANHIGDGPDLAVILNRIIDRTNAGDDNSRVLLIGHSFGARVLEHAIESGRVTLYDTLPGDSVVRPRVDLVLYVNSANDSRLAMGRVQELRAAKLRVRHPDFDPAECSEPPPPAARIELEARAARCRDYPLLVAITSRGDSATKSLLPVANTVNGDALIPGLVNRLPPLPTTNSFADPPPSASLVRKTAAGHFGFLQSHDVREISCPVLRSLEREAAPDARQRAEEQARFERAIHPVCAVNDMTCRFVFRTLGDKPSCYEVDQRQPVDGRPPFNDTPFWIMSVDPTVIKDHGDIWNVSFVEMLGQLMAPRGFFEPKAARVQLRAGASASK